MKLMLLAAAAAGLTIAGCKPKSPAASTTPDAPAPAPPEATAPATPDDPPEATVTEAHKKTLAEVLDLEREAKFTVALRKAKELRQTVEIPAFRDEVQALINRLVEEETAAADLEYARENLAGDSATGRQVARQQFIAAGRAGKVILRNVFANSKNPKEVQAAMEILRDVGEAEDVEVFYQAMLRESDPRRRDEFHRTTQVLIDMNSSGMDQEFLLKLLEYGNRLNDPDESAYLRALGRNWRFASLPPRLLDARLTQIEQDRDFGKRHIAEYLALVHRHAGGTAAAFEKLFTDGAGYTDTLRKYVASAKKSNQPRIVRWGMEVELLLGGRLAIPSNRVVFYFPMSDERASMDKSGQRHDGKHFNFTLAPVDGILKEALTFTGTEYIEVASSRTIKQAHQGDFSYSIWVCPDAFPDDRQPDPYWLVIGRPDPHTGIVITPRRTPAFQYTVRGAKASKEVVCEPVEQLKTAEWVHLAATVNHNQGEVRLYVNGKAAAKYEIRSHWKLGPQDGPLRIGAAAPDAGENKCRFRGKLDEAIMYDRALDESEITTLYYLPRIYSTYGQGL